MFISHFMAKTPAPSDEQHWMVMGIVLWIFIGLIAGFLGSKIVNKGGDANYSGRYSWFDRLGCGDSLQLFGIHAGGLIGSIIVATIGAIIVLIVYQKLIRGNRAA